MEEQKEGIGAEPIESGCCEGKGLRHSIEHMGDTLVDVLVKAGDITVDATANTGVIIWKGIKITGSYLAKGASITGTYIAKGAKAAGSMTGRIVGIGGIGEKTRGLITKTTDSSLTFTRGIILTYDIHELKSKKTKITRKIGERIVEARKDLSSRYTEDPLLKDLLEELDKIDSQIAACITEREERLSAPAKSEPVSSESVQDSSYESKDVGEPSSSYESPAPYEPPSYSYSDSEEAAEVSEDSGEEQPQSHVEQTIEETSLQSIDDSSADNTNIEEAADTSKETYENPIEEGSANNPSVGKIHKRKKKRTH